MTNLSANWLLGTEHLQFSHQKQLAFLEARNAQSQEYQQTSAVYPDDLLTPSLTSPKGENWSGPSRLIKSGQTLGKSSKKVQTRPLKVDTKHR